MVKRNAQNIAKLIAGENGYDSRAERRRIGKFKTSNKGTIVHKSETGNVYIKASGTDNEGAKLEDTFIGNVHTKAGRRVRL